VINVQILNCIDYTFTVNKSVGTPYCLAEMYAGRVACCLLVNHGEYADRTDGRTDGQTPDRYFALSARRGQRKKERVLVLSNHDAVIYLLNDEQSVKEY